MCKGGPQRGCGGTGHVNRSRGTCETMMDLGLDIRQLENGATKYLRACVA